ncbi:MAG: sugar ABC transporter permease [Phycisphaerales bacterium]|nr:sugar ABC transporter permease [Phycisphaerales bacterium]
MNISRRFAPWILLAPFLATFAVFFVYPVFQSLLLACRQTFGNTASAWVGLDNFSRLAVDPMFWKAVANTFVFTLGSVFIQLPLALLLAILLQSPGIRGRGFYRLALFSPAMVGIPFSATMFAVIFEKRTGVLNQVLHRVVGFDLDYSWLQEHVMWALIVAALWMYTGFNMVFFSAALQNVRRDVAEAAIIDGAGPWNRFLHVTLPAIRPVAGFVVLLSVIGSFQLFELPWLMLNSTAGPDNRGLTVVMYLYQVGFETGNLGHASAVGWVLTVILAALAAVQRWTARGEEMGT